MLNYAAYIPILMLMPLGSALFMLMIPSMSDRRLAWVYSLVSTLMTFVVSLLLAWSFDWGTLGMQKVGEIAWIKSMGLSFGFGLDGVSLWLVLLTTFLMPIVIASSLTAVGQRAREFYFWLLILEAAMIGTFVAADVIFFYVCFEFTLVPLYFLIGVFGSSQRLKAARVFFIYTFTGSMLTLAGVLYVAWFASQVSGGTWTFDIYKLTVAAQQMSFTEQAWVLAALLAGFAVKVPLFPVHTWLPLAHTEAPTAGSVILAGVLLKLGTYGLLRFAIPMCPSAVVAFAPYIGVLAVAGILYTALICWVQKDVKRLIAYSSVSHLGFCVLGLFALDNQDIGAIGAVMYMINHGLSTGALFLCVGMIYERFHTREMAAMGGLARVMPVWSVFMVFFVLASVGLPGLNGFIGEFLTLMGTFLSEHTLGWRFAAAAGFGMIFAAMYLLYLVGKVIFGPVKVPHVDPAWTRRGDDHKPMDLCVREIAVLTPLAVACLVLGLACQPVLKSLEEPVATLTYHAKIAATNQSLIVEAQPSESKMADESQLTLVEGGEYAESR